MATGGLGTPKGDVPSADPTGVRSVVLHILCKVVASS